MNKDLGRLLGDEADAIFPSQDGLHRIRQGIGRRRRRRLVLVPTSAMALTAVLATVALLPGHDTRDEIVTVRPSPTATTSAPASPRPSATTPATTTATTTAAATLRPQATAPVSRPPAGTPSPSASPGAAVPATPDGSTTWPFATDAQAQSWQADPTSFPWAADPQAVVQHLLADHLGISGVTVSPACNGCLRLALTVQGRIVGKASWVRMGDPAKGPRPVSVTTIGETDLRITSPARSAGASSPLTVTGRITGVDESVVVTLVTSDGRVLSTTSAPAGSARPWTASLSWTDPAWSYAAIVATTFSAKDGSLSRITLLPVHRA